MNYRQEKFVQFQDWKSEKSYDGLVYTNEGIKSGKFGLSMNAFSRKFRLGFERSSERIANLHRSFRSHSFSSLLAKGVGSSKTILDLQGPFLQKWNKIFVISCIIAPTLDPLFFYIPVINDVKKCVMLDKKLETTACVLRSFKFKL